MLRKGVMALALISAPVQAERNPAIKTGNDLIEACRSSGWESGYCYGYVLGIYRAYETVGAIWGKPLLCGTEDATVEQAMLVVLDYLRSHPRQMNQASEYGVIAALMDAFPCPTK